MDKVLAIIMAGGAGERLKPLTRERDPLFNLYGEKWLFRTYQRPLPPSKCILGGKTLESMVCDGCIVSDGTVWNSILSPA